MFTRTVNSMWNFFGTAASWGREHSDAAKTAPMLKSPQPRRQPRRIGFLDPRRLKNILAMPLRKCKKCRKNTGKTWQNGWFGFQMLVRFMRVKDESMTTAKPSPNLTARLEDWAWHPPKPKRWKNMKPQLHGSSILVHVGPKPDTKKPFFRWINLNLAQGRSCAVPD